MDAVDSFLMNDTETHSEFCAANNLTDKPIVALLAGSRKQEIKSNLVMMLDAMKQYPQYQPIIAGAPGIDKELYAPYLTGNVKILYGSTYRLLKHSHAALVTSGTTTLETALFRVPQVVCYATPMAKLYSWLKRHFLKVKFVSLVNLIAGREVVRELVAADMTRENVEKEIGLLLGNTTERNTMLSEYDKIIEILGSPGASERAAETMIKLLSNK